MSNAYDFIENKKKLYRSFQTIYSPILKENVYFTSEGLSHLLFESNRKPRTIAEQIFKLACVEFAPEVLSKSVHITEVRRYKRKIKGKQKEIVAYEVVHTVKENIQIRVVVEKIGNGKCAFKSIMPHNGKSRKNLQKQKKHP